jgi:hypothetical protein
MAKLKMRYYRIIILTFLIVFCTLTVFAENKLAIINDPDGHTNVRSGQGTEFPVIATINKDEFFYCDLTGSEWVRIIAMKWIEGKQVEGYIHNSIVQIVETLDKKKQEELLKQILTEHKSLADNFRKACKNKDSIAYRTTIKNLEYQDDVKYTPILDILPKYFCLTKDSVILELFYATMWADKGSANEAPGFAIGECFICFPDIVIEQLRKLKNSEHEKLIIDNIEWGLLSYFEVEEDSKSDNQEFNKLKTLLDNERNKARP